ncbi:MAG: hypothetical protein BM556_07770 [Bacteriovorax sp. MedPE-SWde]|nr:MAG: hypothetical protein BM556_07770 [Bacteriovorax sp. MedPE-SWde]
MKYIILLFISLTAFTKDYTVQEGSLTYTVNHPLKTIYATSTNVKGKIDCTDLECSFLAATPTKSFVSKDGNRDVKMWHLLKANQFPIITVSGKSNDKNFSKIQVSIMNKKYFYTDKDFKIKLQDTHAKGFLNIKLSHFDIEQPSLFGFSIEDQIRVNFDLKLKNTSQGL